MFGKFLVHAWRQCEDFEQRISYIGSLRIKLILACQEMLTCVNLALTEQKKVALRSNSITSSEYMDHKWERVVITIACKNNQWKIIGNQLPMNSPIEFKDTPNYYTLYCSWVRVIVVVVVNDAPSSSLTLNKKNL